MTDAPAIKISKTAPAGATAVAELVFSDRIRKVPGMTKAVLDRAGFGGKVGETLVLHDGGAARVLVGAGAHGEVDANALRRASAALARAVLRHPRIAVQYPDDLDVDPEEGVRAVAEGLQLGAYRFDDFKSGDAKPRTSSATIAVGDQVRAVQEAARRGRATAAAVYFARDLVNNPGGTLTPTVFAERVVERGEAAGITVEVLDADAIAEERLGGLLAVNQGSVEEPRLLKLTYEPSATADVDEPAGDGAPEADAVDTIALVGKGITFDSGGLSIKPADSMMDMKCDMAGAAAVVATMCALPALDVPVRVVGFTPLTDNMTGGAAQRPGDIYTARNGTTVEVLNTDAEGRLVLAEALILACEEEPDAVIDLATLTGACMVALGNKIAGLMGNDDDFSDTVVAAADLAGERVWPLPLPDDYAADLDSPIADLKNIGAGRYGGALTAGLFLEKFITDGTPWVHLDIAGPAFAAAPDGEYPKGGTGFAVRTLLTLLESWNELTEPDELDDADELEVVEA